MSLKEKSSRKTKSSQKESLANPGSSAEYVIDSDGDSGAEQESLPSKKSSAGHMNGESNSGQSLKRKAVETPSTSNKKAKVNGTKTSSRPQAVQDTKSDSENDSTSSSNSESDLESAVHAGIQKTHDPKINGRVKSTLDMNLELSEDSEEESSDGEEDAAVVTQNVLLPTKAVTVPSSSTIPDSLPYLPPKGFSLANINSELTASIREIFSVDNIKADTQIWHITAPASVPISDIKRITRPQLLDGTVLTHKGTKYGFSIEGPGAASRLLIPSRKGSKYQPVARGIDQTLHLRQLVNLPITKNVDTQESLPGSIVGARKPVLKQPQGLKLKYRPIGDADLSEDERREMRQAKQRVSNAQIPLPEIVSPKKSKKKSKSAAVVEPPTEWIDPQAYNAPIVVGATSQHTIELPPETTGEMQSSQTGKETSEEKAKRKAEKAARKEAKKQKRQEESKGVAA